GLEPAPAVAVDGILQGAARDERAAVGHPGQAVAEEVPRDLLHGDHTRVRVVDRRAVRGDRRVVLRAADDEDLAGPHEADVDRIDRHRVGKYRPLAGHVRLGGGTLYADDRDERRDGHARERDSSAHGGSAGPRFVPDHLRLLQRGRRDTSAAYFRMRAPKYRLRRLITRAPQRRT